MRAPQALIILFCTRLTSLFAHHVAGRTCGSGGCVSWTTSSSCARNAGIASSDEPVACTAPAAVGWISCRAKSATSLAGYVARCISTLKYCICGFGNSDATFCASMCSGSKLVSLNTTKTQSRIATAKLAGCCTSDVTSSVCCLDGCVCTTSFTSLATGTSVGG